MKKIILLLLPFLFTILSCQEEDRNKTFMPFDEYSAMVYLQKSEDYALWNDILELSGLAESYNYSTTFFTLFVIKNDAIKDYLKLKYGYDNVEQMTQEEASQLIKYHTLPHKVYELTTFRDGKLPDSTSSGDYLSCLFSTGENGGLLMNRVARIVKWDIPVVNGMLHELDQVIDPVMYTHYDYITDSERFSILKAAIDLTENQSIYNDLNMENVPLKIRRTSFLTSDSVFNQHEIKDIEDLKARISPNNTDYTHPDNPLNMYVRYQIIEGDYTTKELGDIFEWPDVAGSSGGKRPNVDKVAGFTLPTLALNKLILVQSEGLGYLFNKEVRFIKNMSNIQVRNGFIHEIDGIFELYEPKNILTIAETTEDVLFRQMAPYRNKDVNNTVVSMKRKDFLSTLKWKSTPAEKIDAVSYNVWDKGAYNFLSNQFLHSDVLFVNLGPVGELTITTRPIPAGTYAIRFIYRRTKRVGGIFQPFIDGEKHGAGEISAYDAEWDSWPWPMDNVIWDRMTFEETKSHTFTIKVTKPGEIHWDLIRFEPVK